MRLLTISSNRFRKISEKFNTLDSLKLDGVNSPSRMFSVSSGKKLNGEEIAETLLAEASFTTASDKKPIVATFGCGPCVALGGFDSTNKIAFMVHFTNSGEVRNSCGLILSNINKLVKRKITSPIQLHLRGGYEGKSEPIIKAIKILMRQNDDLPMEIASKDILVSDRSLKGKSLSIDSRTGAVSDYNPMDNPKSRGISYESALSARLSFYMPQIQIAYSPS
ncbi:MAG: hypothetical protein JHC93_08705 [Parachlamydiales bacterium]|nr:hypothetical protein [Parachlamydiales bacterium]